MTITIALNDTFKHLTGGSLARKQNASSRENEAVCDITFGAADDYVSDGKTLDFSVIRKFKQIYSCEVVHRSFGRQMSFVPASGNDSATGKLKIWHTDGTELSNGNTGTRSMTLTVIIRGN